MDLTAADEKLLKALAIAIVDHPRATFKEIAQAAGVSKATLNRFCGTRDNLIEMLLDHGSVVIYRVIADADLESAPLDALHRLIEGLEQRGRIRRMKGHARAIEILDKEPVDLRAALRAVNEAAYAAARMAGKEQHPSAEALRRIALDTDRLMDEAA